MKIIREHINEKFKEESDPIHDLGIGIRDFLEKEFKIEGNTSSEQGSLKFFKSTKYTQEAFAIYIFLKYLLYYVNISQEAIDTAFKRMLNHEYAEGPLGRRIKKEKVKEALKNYYGLNINES